MSGYGGYVKGFVSGVRPGVACAHCGTEVNIAPFGWAANRPNKKRVIRKGEPKRRPNPERRSVISRAVCSDCHNKGLE